MTQIYLGQAVTGSYASKRTYVQVSESFPLVTSGGLYVKAGEGFAWLDEAEARRLTNALVAHFAARDAAKAEMTGPKVYEAGSAVVILSEEARSSIDPEPVGLRRGQVVTVVEGPDDDGDYSILTEDDDEWYIAPEYLGDPDEAIPGTSPEEALALIAMLFHRT